MKTIKMCGVLVHYPYDPYPQQLSISQVVIRACSRLQNGAVEIPTGCGKTMALLCSTMGYQVEQRYKILELMSNDDTIWETSISSEGSEVAEASVGAAASGWQPEAVPAAAARQEEDEDFVALPRRLSAPAHKKARLDCGEGCAQSQLQKGILHAQVGDGACCSALLAGDVAGSGGDAPAAASCGRPLADIEDTALPQEWQGRPWPGEAPELIDLASSSSTQGSSSSSESSSPPPPPPEGEEVLSQSFWERGGEGEGEGGEEEAWGPRVTREAMRRVLRGRAREPAPGGEYAPTRRLHVPRNCAPIRVPKIFYASRTHLQLEQVANEIKRTNYCDARVVVLSSREFTCVNDKEFRTRKYANRTEMCHELLNDVPVTNMSWSEVVDMTQTDEISSKSSCGFFAGSKRYATHDAMEAIGVGPVVDINVLVQAGHRHKFCPYFVARNLISTADIILCPVNYLIDPLVRKSMNMELRGEIVVIDEAHMLDDLCRETASIIVPISDLKECLKDCSTLVDRQQLPGAHRTMAAFLEDLTSWIEMNSKKTLSYGFNNEKEFSVSSSHLIASLEQSKITQEMVSKFMEGLGEASRHKNDVLTNMSKSTAFFKVISSKTETICERLGLIMDFVFRYPDEYVGSITLTNKYGSETAFHSRKEQEWAIKLVCQNAGLIFNTLSSVTRSIIFSSATLSPLSAFAAELDIKIQNTSVRGHVIPPMQTWIGSLGRSKSGHELYGRYSNTKSVEYMDEIGNIVLDVCVRVPYGVLVFVSAYWTLENIVQRWKDTGLWTKIGEHKRPFSETRRAKEFNEVLQRFYNAVEEARAALQAGLVTEGNGCTGPLLVAVMRGKVSEGFNFADDKTRAIVTVGIPYPNIHEDAIRWKREYNKVHSLNKPLQDAEGWYNTQAFRALSQSLGRGLRHRQDWCMLLLVDTRFQQVKYSQMLPQWMFERMVTYHEYTGMLNSVEEYLKRMKLFSKDC